MSRLPCRLALVLGAAILVAPLGACSPTVNTRGNLPSPDLLAQIKPGVTDKASVTQLLGSPSSVASFDDTTWYYISQKSEELAFFKPEVRDPEVVAVIFDKDGTVKDVQKRSSKTPRSIEPVARTTPAPGKELSFIEQLIGNFGKFNTNSAAGK
ncbi:MAG TPA: outer membrane protein assembly factor BamE [Stellaceae bacterium]|nr:outer membrane protein assembly factor BamE [Stellaceae bacterium]